MKKVIIAIALCLCFICPAMVSADAGATLSPTESLVVRLFPDFPTLCGDYFYNCTDGASAIGVLTPLATYRFLFLKAGYLSEVKGGNSENIGVLDLGINLNTLVGKNHLAVLFADLFNISVSIWTGLDLSVTPVKFKWGVEADIVRLYFGS